ncbi:MAG TPA: hypothetical protein ENI61_05980 [Ignavibacteria bacterium]|nr:hypothetical protein [Ignavibacteria bacterium]
MAFSEANASLSSIINTYSELTGLDSYVNESQLEPMSHENRVFLIFESTNIPILPYGNNDLLICISSLKTKLKDSRANKSYDFPTLKTFKDNNEVIRWILKEGDFFNIDLNRVANLLFVSSGKSLRKIFSEIRKLAVLTSPGSIVSEETAKSILCFSTSITPSSIVDSICEGNPVKALVFYDKLQSKVDETGWIIAFLQRHTLRHLIFSSLIESGIDTDSIACKSEIHPFVFKKMHEPYIGLWSVESLIRSFSSLCVMDTLHKMGNDSSKISLELEIIRLSEESRYNAEQRNSYNN